MKVYFDTCSLHRPLDDKSQHRVRLEAEAVLGVLGLCEARDCSLVSSEVLSLEVARNPQPQRRAFVTAILDNAANVIQVDHGVRQRAEALELRGFKAFDALHIACAESGEVDWFCTCDDRLLKKARSQSDLKIRVVSPLELANEVSP